MDIILTGIRANNHAAKVMHIIGDSHIRPLLVLTKFQGKAISGATMSGVMNPNSKTNSHRLIKEYILNVSTGDSVLLCLGEVDVGYLTIVKGKNEVGLAEKYIRNAIKKYGIFYRELKELRPDVEFYISNVPPIITDDSKIKKLKIKDRRNIRMTYKDRCHLLNFANQCLSDEFTNLIDIHAEFSSHIGIFRSSHINKADHHYDSYFFISAFYDALGIKLTNRVCLKIICFVYDLRSFIK